MGLPAVSAYQHGILEKLDSFLFELDIFVLLVKIKGVKNSGLIEFLTVPFRECICPSSKSCTLVQSKLYYIKQGMFIQNEGGAITGQNWNYSQCENGLDQRA